MAGAMYQALPLSLRDMADATALPTVMRLIRTYGGRRLCVPADGVPTAEMIARLGNQHAHAIASYCPGERLEPPRGLGALRARRDAEINAMLDAGSSADAVAEAVGLTRRQVQNIRARYRRAKRFDEASQRELF